MHKFTAIYQEVTDGERSEQIRTVLVNLAKVCYVRELGDRRLIIFDLNNWIEVQESMTEIEAIDNPMAAIYNQP